MLVHVLKFLGFQIYGDFLKTFWASVLALFWVSPLRRVDYVFISIFWDCICILYWVVPLYLYMA